MNGWMWLDSDATRKDSTTIGGIVVKKKLFVLCSFILALSMIFTLSVSASSYTDDDIIASKQAFRTWAQSQMMETNAIRTFSDAETENIEHLLMQYVSDPNANKTDIEGILANNGVYLLKDNCTTYTVMRSESGNISLHRPMISYDAARDRWSVTMGGYWLDDDAWMADYSVGSSSTFPCNLGGPDSFGISLYDVTGYNSAAISYSAFMNDGAGTEKTTTSRSYGDGKTGVGFQIQDYVHWASPSVEIAYVGKRFGAIVTYDSRFVNCSGTMVSYYAHTYNTTRISGIKLGLSSSPSVEVTFSGGQNGFSCESGETSF